MTEYLDLDDLQFIILRGLGQKPEVLVRDWGLLESAVHRPASVVFGTEAYPSLDTKAAALLHSIVKNHPLLDGNKRLAWLSTRLFYAKNDRDLHVKDAQHVDEYIREIASGKHDLEEIAGFLSSLLVEFPRDIPVGRNP